MENINTKEVIGKLIFYVMPGDEDIEEFTDKEEYLKTIKEALNHDPDGDDFQAITISKDPDLLKSVDDLYANTKEVIGKLTFRGMPGEDEVMKFTDKEEYLKTIKRELHYNPDGFRAITISQDPALLKSVDDLYYDNYCDENPHPIEYYQEICAEKVQQNTTSQKNFCVAEIRNAICNDRSKTISTGILNKVSKSPKL